MATVLPGASILQVAQIGSPRADRAFDRGWKPEKSADPREPEADGWETLILRYARTRSASDLARLPLIEGRRPMLYHVGMLKPTAIAALSIETNVTARYQLAVRLAVHRVTLADGTTESAKFESKNYSGSMPISTVGWLDKLAEWGGAQLLTELGSVALRRAEIGDIEDEDGDDPSDPLDRYVLPAGLRLPL